MEEQQPTEERVAASERRFINKEVLTSEEIRSAREQAYIDADPQVQQQREELVALKMAQLGLGNYDHAGKDNRDEITRAAERLVLIEEMARLSYRKLHS